MRYKASGSLKKRIRDKSIKNIDKNASGFYPSIRLVDTEMCTRTGLDPFARRFYPSIRLVDTEIQPLSMIAM
jgi:hypothetical protein